MKISQSSAKRKGTTTWCSKKSDNSCLD